MLGDARITYLCITLYIRSVCCWRTEVITTRRFVSGSLLNSEFKITFACVQKRVGLVGLRQDDVALALRVLYCVLFLADQRLVYVRNDTAAGNGCLDQAVQLLVSANGEL